MFKMLRRPVESAQYAAELYRETLAANGLIGSMGRRGNPYDNAKAESFMNTLKVEAVYPMAFETFEEITEHLPHFIEEAYNNKRWLHSALGYFEPPRVRGSTHPPDWQISSLIHVHPKGRTPIRGQSSAPVHNAQRERERERESAPRYRSAAEKRHYSGEASGRRRCVRRDRHACDGCNDGGDTCQSECG
ncbi:transposase (plasmid) [Rhizobium sp. 007]|nr:transposase [Rhizobium sp. 007]